MRQDNYWLRRMTSSRLSRRRFVGGAATAGIGATGLALVGCGDDDDDDDGGPTTGPTATTASGQTAAPTATEVMTGPQKGGVRRATSANNTFDTFDADRSRFTPFAGILGWTNLGIVHYRNWENAELEGGFAESWETPDDLTVVLKLRKGLKWHDKPPVNGREATVEDMKFFIDRNRNGLLQDGTEDPNFYRKAEYGGVQSVDVVDAETLSVKFSEPDPFFFGLLAGSYAKVQAPEAVAEFESDYQNLRADLIIGTGSFILTEFNAEGSATFVRNEEFFDVENAWLDGLDFLPLFTDQAAQQAAFEQKQVDMFGPSNKDVLDDLLARYDDQIYDTPSFAANPMAGTYYGGAEPWSNGNLIGAIFKTIDRRLLIQQLVQGRAAISGNVPPTQNPFAIAESELVTFDGYFEDHAKDLAEAKQMWEAGGGAALGDITVDIPDIWEGVYSGVSASLTGMLKENLGNNFVAKIEPYSTITNKLINQSYGNGSANIWYGWISDIQKLEPTPDLHRLYNSSQPQFFQFGVKIDEFDTLSSQAVRELDVEKRIDMVKDMQRLLIKNWGAGIPYNLIQIVNTLRWNYYHTGESPAFVNAHNTYRDDWFDQNDPTWQGRKA